MVKYMDSDCNRNDDRTSFRIQSAVAQYTVAHPEEELKLAQEKVSNAGQKSRMVRTQLW
jgi:hypothetical protein